MQNTHDNELIRAINSRDHALVRAALDAGANPEAPDQHGCAGLPLRRACFLGYQEIVVELLQRGANPNAANADGPGASIRMAQRGGHKTIATLLQQYILFNHGGKPEGQALPQADHQVLFDQPFSGQSERVPATSKTTEADEKVDILLDFNIEHEIVSLAKHPETEHLEIEACYGVDTQVLLEDVARIMNTDTAAQDLPAANPPKAGGFWQRAKK